MPAVSSVILAVVEAVAVLPEVAAEPVLPEAVAKGKMFGTPGLGAAANAAAPSPGVSGIHQDLNLAAQLIQYRMIQKLYILLLRLQFFNDHNIILTFNKPLSRYI